LKITVVDIFEYELAYRRGPYALSGNRSQMHQRALVVRIETDEKLIGWGETCPMGRTHLSSFFEGEREALSILARSVIGLDPRDTGVVQVAMSRALLAGMSAKSAIDVACWDILGKACGMPLSSLLGGGANRKHSPSGNQFRYLVPTKSAHMPQSPTRGASGFFN
jgi:L-alanine-DL-glutamate epimerase-like enolase superfamily enzyme